MENTSGRTDATYNTKDKGLSHGYQHQYYFVVCTVGSTVQMRAIRDALDREPGLSPSVPPAFEGDTTDRWVLADFGGVVVHVFAEDARAYYRLDELWSDAPVIVRLQ